MWCWWCCHPFEGETLHMPYKYDDKRNKFKVCGNFCSWSCMKSYALDKYGLNKGSIICGNIIMMRRKMYNHLGSVKPSPNRFLLDVFGGNMTITEFRKNLTIDKGESKSIIKEPVVDIVMPFISNKAKMNEIKNSSTDTNDTLKLKRTKPLKRNYNNLESALGLIITPKS